MWSLAGLGGGWGISLWRQARAGAGRHPGRGMSPVMRHRVLRMWRWADKVNTMRWYHQPPVPPPHNLHFYQVTWHWTPCKPPSYGGWRACGLELSKKLHEITHFLIITITGVQFGELRSQKPPVGCDPCGQASQFHVSRHCETLQSFVDSFNVGTSGLGCYLI